MHRRCSPFKKFLPKSLKNVPEATSKIRMMFILLSCQLSKNWNNNPRSHLFNSMIGATKCAAGWWIFTSTAFDLVAINSWGKKKAIYSIFSCCSHDSLVNIPLVWPRHWTAAQTTNDCPVGSRDLVQVPPVGLWEWNPQQRADTAIKGTKWKRPHLVGRRSTDLHVKLSVSRKIVRRRRYTAAIYRILYAKWSIGRMKTPTTRRNIFGRRK